MVKEWNFLKHVFVYYERWLNQLNSKNCTDLGNFNPTEQKMFIKTKVRACGKKERKSLIIIHPLQNKEWSIWWNAWLFLNVQLTLSHWRSCLICPRPLGLLLYSWAFSIRRKLSCDDSCTGGNLGWGDIAWTSKGRFVGSTVSSACYRPSSGRFILRVFWQRVTERFFKSFFKKKVCRKK